MAITTFGVTAADVQSTYFPQLGAFTAASNPTALSVARYVNEEAATLMGALAQEGLAAAALVEATYPAAFMWCAETVRLGVACKAYSVMSQRNPEILKDWRAELKARYKRLDEYGYIALGDAPAPAEEANGPRTHIGELNLTTAEDDLSSDAVPSFRKSDLL